MLNYPIEKYEITTKDNYIVSLFRIQAKNTKISENIHSQAILMHPGINCAVDSLIANYEHKAPPLFLANRGMDVWVLNIRGNFYDMKHKIYDSTKDNQFYEYTWEQMADFDIPAAVELITNKIGKNVHLIGYSQGAGVIMGSLAQQNETISELTKTVTLIGPSIFISKSESFLIKMVMNFKLLEKLYDFGFRQLNPLQDSKTGENPFLFYLTKYGMVLNKYVLYLLSDSDLSGCHFERYLNYIAHYPFGTSIKNYIHFSQQYRSNKFQRFDYGEKNMQYYNQSYPPEYDLSLVYKKIFMVIARDDLMSSIADNLKLKDELVNSIVDVHYMKGGHLCAMINRETEFIEKIYYFIRDY